MLLIPQINFRGDLFLDAYSFNEEEIALVEAILKRISSNLISEILIGDRLGRSRVRFLIGANDILKLEQAFNLKFVGKNRDTKVIFGEPYDTFDGEGQSSFRCSRIDIPPHDCETIYADDYKEAILKCALIANQLNWLGGVAFPGHC